MMMMVVYTVCTHTHHCCSSSSYARDITEILSSTFSWWEKIWPFGIFRCFSFKTPRRCSYNLLHREYCIDLSLGKSTRPLLSTQHPPDEEAWRGYQCQSQLTRIILTIAADYFYSSSTPRFRWCRKMKKVKLKGRLSSLAFFQTWHSRWKPAKMSHLNSEGQTNSFLFSVLLKFLRKDDLKK